VLYYGTQVLLKSEDRGVTWEEISPDLTKNEKDKQGLNGGPLTPENVGAEFYGTIFYISESPHEGGTLWIGSDDGLLHLTRDDGRSWEDVTPGDLGGAQINAIEISPHDAGTVYIAVAGYKLNDFQPYIYKGTDYGRSWERIDEGLPRDKFVRVVREDPDREGLLYAGTEGGMFVSFDDGGSWQSLDLNLPPVPITDLAIRQGNLVAATQGRGFWVLDDLNVLQQANPEMAGKPLHLFEPKPTPMVRFGGGGGGEGKNPPSGAVLSYFLAEEMEGPLTIEITDSNGQEVRSYSSEEGEFERCIVGNMDQRLPFTDQYPTRKAGLNQWTWDMRRNGLHCIDDIRLFAGFDGATVIPGEYRVRIAIGGVEGTAGLTLLPDPRVEATATDYAFLDTKIRETTDLLNGLFDRLQATRQAREQIEALLKDHANAQALREAAESAIQRLTDWENLITQTQYETYEDEDSMPPMLDVHVRHLLDVLDRAGAPVSEGSLRRLEDLKVQWSEWESELLGVLRTDIAAVNGWARENGVPHIRVSGG
jgi:hypothetical protein